MMAVICQPCSPTWPSSASDGGAPGNISAWRRYSASTARRFRLLRNALDCCPNTMFSAAVIGQERQFLVHDADPCALRLPRPAKPNLAATIHPDAAGRRLLETAEDLDQCALAGAVGPQEPVHLAAGELEVDAPQHDARGRIDL